MGHWDDFEGYKIEKSYFEKTHRVFSHEDGYPVCPECGELLFSYLPEDKDERQELLVDYARYKAYLLGHLEKPLYIISSAWFVFLSTFLVDIFNPVGPGARFPFGGPFIRPILLCLVAVLLHGRGLHTLLSKLRSSTKEDLGEGGDGFVVYWFLRIAVWIIFLVFAYVFLPNYFAFSGRNLPSDLVQAYQSYCLNNYIIFYPPLAIILFCEYRQYRRSRLILFLNGKDW